MVDPEQILNLLSVLCEPLQHAALRNAQTCQGPRLQMAVTTESTRSILSVKECADSGAMTIFKPHGGGRTTQDKEAIWNITKILNSTQGFDVVYEIGAYVLDTKNRESSQTQYVQPVIRNDRRGRALSQAAKEHERKRKLESEGFETNLDQPDRTTPN